ncbi:ABC transporter substrate-binding protein [soil metagenome]
MVSMNNGSAAPSSGEDMFEQYFRQILAGKLTRRQAVARTAGAGAMAAGAFAVSPSINPALRTLAQDAEPVAGGTLRMGMQSDPGALDTQLQSLTAAWHVVEHIYSNLTKIMPDMSVAPELAESWDISEDGITYTFHLHQGAMFHNGREVQAEDVKFSLERLVAPETASPSASDLASMASIEAVDEYTVVMTLTAPDAALLANLSFSSCIIFPPEVIEENGDLTQVAVGSGPFRFIEYVPNTQITLERFEDYFEAPLPYLDGVELLIAATDNSRTAALVSNTVDFIEYVPPQDIELLEADDSIVLTGNAIAQIRMIGFNLEREPFSDVRVRRAVAMAVDRGPIIDAALFGYGTPTDIIFPADFWAAPERPEIPAPDIEGALALMAEAGFEDGFDTTLTGWAEYGFLSNSAIVVQEQLKAIGINAEMNLLDTGTMGQTVYIDKDYDMTVTGTSGFVDPSGVILENFQTGEGGNFVNYSNPEVDQLIADGAAATEQAERATIYQRIQEILLEDLPWVNLYIGQQYEAMKTYVMGYEHIPTGSNKKVREVWLDQ